MERDCMLTCLARGYITYEYERERERVWVEVESRIQDRDEDDGNRQTKLRRQCRKLVGG